MKNCRVYAQLVSLVAVMQWAWHSVACIHYVLNTLQHLLFIIQYKQAVCQLLYQKTVLVAQKTYL